MSRHHITLSALLLLSSASLGLSREPIPAAPRRAEQPPRQMIAGPHLTARLHLLAEEVERSGLHDEAAAMHELAERVQHRSRELLAAKTRRLHELETEVHRLREEIHALSGHSGPRAQVRVQMLEMPAELAESLKLDRPSSTDSAHGLPRNGITSRRELLKRIEELAAKKQLKRIAEPTLVVPTGRTGEFHSGGEFPIVVPQQDGSSTIQFRPFGQRLEVRPESIGDGRWRLDLEIESSERDFSNAVQSEHIIVPGLTSRHVATRVELHEGSEAAIFSTPHYKRHPEPLGAKRQLGRVEDPQDVCLVTVVTVDPTDEPEQIGPLNPIPTY
ncbi:MAG: hypothetical protein ACK5Q5_17795 [Planctomycetaceae bacterium]